MGMADQVFARRGSSRVRDYDLIGDAERNRASVVDCAEAPRAGSTAFVSGVESENVRVPCARNPSGRAVCTDRCSKTWLTKRPATRGASLACDG